MLGFAVLPSGTATPQQNKIINNRDETCLRLKTTISYKTSSNFRMSWLQIDGFLRVFSWTASLLPQNGCFVQGFRQFAAHVTNLHVVTTWRGNLKQHWQCDSPKQKGNTIRLKCCACHSKLPWKSSKCCPCHEKHKTSSENIAELWRLSHKTIFDTLSETWQCHEAPRLPHKTALHNVSMAWP